MNTLDVSLRSALGHYPWLSRPGTPIRTGLGKGQGGYGVWRIGGWLGSLRLDDGVNTISIGHASDMLMADS